jgi:hypothetical protein
MAISYRQSVKAVVCKLIAQNISGQPSAKLPAES